jgi:hypothetical protein
VSHAARTSDNERLTITGFVARGDTEGLIGWLGETGWADPRMVRAMLAAAGGHLLITPANYADRRTQLVVEARPAIGGLALKIREPRA